MCLIKNFHVKHILNERAGSANYIAISSAAHSLISSKLDNSHKTAKHTITCIYMYIYICMFPLSLVLCGISPLEINT